MHLVEQLESRQLFASFTAASVADLIADINAANAAGGSNTITLAPATTFKLTAVDNSIFAPTGLPVIAAGDNLTIIGNGDTIQRSTARSTSAFRLFAVDTGASLTLNSLTLSNGIAVTDAVPLSYSAQGGAIRSQGTLSLDGVTVQSCIAQAQIGDFAYGGGIFSNGALTIANSVIQNNQALGGNAINSSGAVADVGRPAFGGGLYVSGSDTISNTRISSNLARGGAGQDGYTLKGGKSGFPGIVRGGGGGLAWGGGIFVGAGTLQLLTTTVTQNAATGGPGGTSPKNFPDGPNGTGQGGGIYIYPGASVSLDSFTAANTTANTASTSDNDIFGSFTIL